MGCYKEYLKKESAEKSEDGAESSTETTSRVLEQLTLEEKTELSAVVEESETTASEAKAVAAEVKVDIKDDLTDGATAASAVLVEVEKEKKEEAKDSKKKNRCLSCKKKVGLTGFTCRCGGLFCSIHRYSDKHDCTFDYKELGAEEIRKSNPVVVASKLNKI